jgi:hypothetical protein
MTGKYIYDSILVSDKNELCFLKTKILNTKLNQIRFQIIYLSYSNSSHRIGGNHKLNFLILGNSILYIYKTYLYEFLIQAFQKGLRNYLEMKYFLLLHII